VPLRYQGEVRPSNHAYLSVQERIEGSGKNQKKNDITRFNQDGKGMNHPVKIMNGQNPKRVSYIVIKR
jgi:hypothetical protein